MWLCDRLQSSETTRNSASARHRDFRVVSYAGAERGRWPEYAVAANRSVSAAQCRNIRFEGFSWDSSDGVGLAAVDVTRHKMFAVIVSIRNLIKQED